MTYPQRAHRLTWIMQRDECRGAKVVFIEPFAGISGDMFLGALLDLGVRLEYLREQFQRLPLLGFELAAGKCSKSGIRATRFEVHLHPEGGHHGHHHRTFRDIRRLISESSLSPWVREKALAAFEKLAVAEGKIHDVAVDEVHFHEVGAVDSIVDIVGVMIAFEQHRPASVICAPVNVGHGTVECRHGVYPVPAPATIELLRGVPAYSNALAGELTTPTGAALLATLVDRFGARPLMRSLASGYGAGSRDLPGAANVLRITVGEEQNSKLEAADEQIAVIEASIDDMNPQIYGYLFDRILAAGALDVYLTPVQMKKNRPGTVLTVLCKPGDLDGLSGIIFAEATTLGIRYRLDQRKTLERRIESVSTPQGEVRVKIALLHNQVVNVAPEFEDCRRLAAASGIPLKEVISAATDRGLALARSANQRRGG